MYNSAVRLSYDDLVRDYLDSLHSKLRNFSVEPEFLATWVHDEDDATSLYEIFAAAREAACREMTVAVGPTVVGRLDRAALESRLAPLGTFRFAAAPDGGWELSASLSAVAAPAAPAAAPKAAAPKVRPAAPKTASTAPKRPEGTHPAYRAGLAALAAAARHEGSAAAAPAGGLRVEAADGDVVLSVSVGPDGVVADARHKGASGELKGALEGLCDLLPGRTFQEGHDHAAIRLEARLRDAGAPPPVTGLLTPRNADPAFAPPLALLRAAYKKWLAQREAKPGWNFWDDRPDAAWLALSPETRMARAKAAVADGCRALGTAQEGVEVLDILNDCRIVLAATPETIKPSFALQMIKLERAVKKAIDPRIELQLESLEDRNRRATRTQRTEKLL